MTGETLAEQNLPGEYENPYKFNAKELDTETELYYYGAGYYNPRLSVWYGVDPLAIWNPVMETEFYEMDIIMEEYISGEILIRIFIRTRIQLTLLILMGNKVNSNPDWILKGKDRCPLLTAMKVIIKN